MNSNAASSHYTHGALEQTILRALAQSGKDPDRLAPEDLAPVDEFHIGGLPATAALAAQLNLRPGMPLLDVGSGLGGPARWFAGHFGCQVTGIDITAEYVAVARSLTARVGLAAQVSFCRASALALPFRASFERAYMLHVGMNIADKPALFAGLGQVLKPGGWCAVYDVMRLRPGDLQYPVPWAAAPSASFLASPADYRTALASAGFSIVAERDCRNFALDFFRAARDRAAAGPPPLGLHLVMGEQAAQKSAHVLAAIEAGLVSPIELIARLP